MSAHIVKVPAVEALKIRRDASLTVAAADEGFYPKTTKNLIETREVSESFSFSAISRISPVGYLPIGLFGKWTVVFLDILVTCCLDLPTAQIY